MSEPVDLLGLYLHLARASRQRMRPHVADRLLIISGTIAARMKLPDIAAYCRRLVLDHNPNHLLRRWATFDAALRDDDFLPFLRVQQRRYPQERAERNVRKRRRTEGPQPQTELQSERSLKRWHSVF